MKPRENELGETHISAAFGLHHPAELLNEAEYRFKEIKKKKKILCLFEETAVK